MVQGWRGNAGTAGRAGSLHLVQPNTKVMQEASTGFQYTEGKNKNKGLTTKTVEGKDDGSRKYGEWNKRSNRYHEKKKHISTRRETKKGAECDKLTKSIGKYLQGNRQPNKLATSRLVPEKI